ncbi:secreted RxLR effector protein 161-like [Lathyrus oleraceus]|uniref:secreted RxLR effector protein 161-like n=1 Tax=Pisum sativum TaxID=3888 RepID=UPI0021CE7D51|nr:secreted RxLR effector protein 161-like [Pisum sativum]
MGKVDATVFIKRQGKHTLLVQVYVDDIIFGSTIMQLVKEFSKLMQSEFEIFSMEDAKLIGTPMPTNENLKKNENGKDVDVKKSKGMIGSLIYLNASRPDIMFSVCMFTRYQLAPKEYHLKVVKRILRYLHGTSNYGIWYSKGSDCNLVGYTDSNFTGFKSDRKSTSGTCHMFSKSLVSWHSEK